MGKPGLLRQVKKGGKTPKWKPKENAFKQYVGSQKANHDKVCNVELAGTAW